MNALEMDRMWVILHGDKADQGLMLLDIVCILQARVPENKPRMRLQRARMDSELSRTSSLEKQVGFANTVRE